MAQVPYSPVPRDVPGPTADPQIRVETPPAAFGVTIAEAERKVGQVTEQVGGEFGQTAEMFQRMQNDTTAKKLFIDNSNKVAETEYNFYQKKGIDSVNARQQYETDLNQIYQTAIDNAPNAQVKQQLSDALSRRVSYAIVDGQRHAGQQQYDYTKDVSNAAVATAVATAAQNPLNESMWNDTLKTIQKEAKAQRLLEGKDQASADLNAAKWTGLAWKARLDQLAFNDPFMAQRLFNAHRSEITGINSQGEPYSLEIERNIQQRMTQKGTKDVAYGLLYGGDYQQRLDRQEGRTKSPTSTAQGYGQITDDTWKDIRKEHPELNLPAKHADATTEQNVAATKAFTADNQKLLADKGITPNMANTYMAHFLGRGGVIRFMEGLADNPNQPASNIVAPEAIKANRPVFFKNDGTMRTAQEVYDKQTAGFAGPGQLNAKSGPDYLQTVLDAAQRWSEKNQPNNPEFYPMLQARITTEYNRVKQVARLENQEVFNSLYGAVIGATGGGRINNMDDIWGNPTLSQQYSYLQNNNPGQAEQIRKTVENSMKQGALPPEAQLAIYNKIKGLGLRAETDQAARDEYERLPMGDLSGQLSQGLVKQLYDDQLHVQKVWQGKADALERNNRLNGALAFLKNTLDPLGIKPAPAGDTSPAGKRQTDLYNTFVGALYTKMTDIERETKKPVTDQVQIMGLAAPILQQLADPRGAWNLGKALGYPNPSPRVFQPSPEMTDKIIENFKNEEGNTEKRNPTPFEVGVSYMKILGSPELRKKYGIP